MQNLMFPYKKFNLLSRLALASLAVLLLAGPAAAQTSEAVLGAGAEGMLEEARQAVPMSMDEAVQIALQNNYALRESRLDVDNAQAQVREAWGQLLPQVDASASYTRNLKSANPFAGSDAGGLFGSLGSIGWLAFNEEARTDGDPSTNPISLMEFNERQASGYQEAGIAIGGSDNPFAVPNQFQGGISISQTLFSGSAFAGIKGASRLKEVNRFAADRQAQEAVDQTRQAYYAALLAEEQAQVQVASVRRTRETVQEATKMVAQGVAPKFERLSAEVELANLQTQLAQAQNQANTALDNLKLTLGISPSQPIRLSDDLDTEGDFILTSVSFEDAVASALERRADLAQAQTAIELQEIQKSVTQSQYLPTVSAVANLSYTGSVPDNRTSTLSDPNDPFSFTQRENEFFSSNYWNPAVSVGVQLSWNIFNGGQTRARVQQQQIAVEKAQVQYEQLRASVQLEVERALRDLRTARQQILSQNENTRRAEVNYEHTDTRLREGVSSPIELREASQQLDQSRLSYAQAVHDYLVARSAFEAAIGQPLSEPSDVQITSN